MRRITLYSSSRSSMAGRLNPTNRSDQSDIPDQAREIASAHRAGRQSRFLRRKFYARGLRMRWIAAGGLCALLLVFAYAAMAPSTRQITQEDIRAAVLHTLETHALPSPAAKAYAVIRPAVVSVRRMDLEKTGGADIERSVGSGVVIVDKGTILTNLHVVLGAKRVGVIFADGLESDATITGVWPEHDLAVLQARTIPDGLAVATIRSTADLALGDQVFAVGFPFGIGPSVTAGVVSGLRREFRSPQGKRLLTNLIQFDAAANPGSSGGPLVTADGAVVGIVTGILNPTQQRVFVGIGFAVPIENAAAAVGVPPF
ncbi:MAG: trypsin-like peptidase domain-containing protein [Deltaproteobacteria bacterium]|nr:trypsin-like peptidase domain-containing protein [Deltaproteobacteria bacterium]MBI3066908.1 trypsin-like peptidase domain-containing protein [Deltaproteobacteria bacterium]